MAQAEIGVIGGSGLYDMEQLTDVEEVRIETPYGDPSDAFILGSLSGRRVAFLPRHGRGHKISPTEINYRANIWAFKKLGVDWLIASSACGSFREELSPGTIVVIDQLFDRTRARSRDITFFEKGIVAHVPFGDPFSEILMEIVHASAVAVDAPVVKGGTYVNMEGPAFSTRAESYFYKGQGFDVIGMTNLFEARLAREAEIHFATLALVTDYDCWYEGHDDVDVEMVVKTMHQNADMFRRIVIEAVKTIPAKRPADPRTDVLGGAIMSDRNNLSEEVKKRLAPILEKHIK